MILWHSLYDLIDKLNYAHILSPCSCLDCFHSSLLAHQDMAKGLWNNMLTPAAQKKISVTQFCVPLHILFVC